MKMLSKKTLAAMIAGTFIIAGAASPFIAQAVEAQESPSAYHHKQGQMKMSPEEAAKRISETFGIEQSTILAYQNNGMSLKDIRKAAFLAKASGKSIEDVVSKKTADNTWKDVCKTLGITKEQMKAARQDIAANHLNKKTDIDKETALDLLHQGYHPRDIGMAKELSKNTNQPINDVLSLKKINNTWSDVASTLGVDKDTFKKDLKEMGYAPHHRGPHQEIGQSRI